MAGGALSRDGLGSPGWGLGMSEPLAEPLLGGGPPVLLLGGGDPPGPQSCPETLHPTGWEPEPHLVPASLSPLHLEPDYTLLCPSRHRPSWMGALGASNRSLLCTGWAQPWTPLQVPSLLQEHFCLCPPPSLTYPGCPVPPNPGQVLPCRRPFLENNKLGGTTPVPTGLSCATSRQCPDAPGLCPPGHLWPFLACGWCPVQPGVLWL